MSWFASLGLFLFCLLPSFSFATGSIELTAYPQPAIADGASIVAVVAIIRDSSGRPVVDSTSVRFSITMGSLRESEVRSIGGRARVEVIAPSLPGVARLTVTVPSIATVNTLDIEFVKDRSELAQARQYVDIFSPSSLFYSSDLRIVSAAAADRKVSLTFGSIRIDTSDMQFDLNSFTVIANDAILTVRNESIECRRLRYHLNRKKGKAITSYEGIVGGYDIDGITPVYNSAGVLPQEFAFADVGLAPSSIHARRIRIFPQREIQFMDARLYVGDIQVMKIPLYALNQSSQSGLFSDQVIGFSNGGLQLNYPYYLSLTANQTSVLRLRSGSDYARGSSSSRGLFLDLEHSYFMGEKGEGKLLLGGIGRSDMGIGWRHSHRLGDQTTLNLLADSPGFKSLYGNVNASHRMKGFSLNASATSSRALRGIRYEVQRADINIESDMRRLGSLPITHSIGVASTSQRAIFGDNQTSQSGVGLKSRLVLLPQELWSGASLTASLTATQFWGKRERAGLGIIGTVSVNSMVGRNTVAQLSYDYADDSFTSSLFGKHRLGAQVYSDSGPFRISFFGNKSLDLDQLSLLADVSYRFKGPWRIGTSISHDRYLGSVVRDQQLILGYTIGIREFAITYSTTTKRFGIEVLNVPIR